MKVVLIEDEPLVAKDLVSLIKRYDPTIEIIKILGSVVESVKFFEAQQFPDLIFSDIQLSDGISFEIFSKVNPPSPIIFTTAYDEFAIKAFKLNSVDYLLKPIDENELKSAFEKFYRFQKSENASYFEKQINTLLKDLHTHSPRKYKTRFTGHLGKSLIAIPEDQIGYFTKDVLIFLTTTDNKQISTDYHSLEELETLVDPSKFFRANRQFIISLIAIDNVKSHFTGKLTIELKSPLKADITVSREKASEFKKWFEGG